LSYSINVTIASLDYFQKYALLIFYGELCIWKNLMVLTTKHKMMLYRRFRKDIWGYCYTDMGYNKALFDKARLFRSRAKFRVQKAQFFRPRAPFIIRKGNLHLLKSRYFKFFFELWWRKRKTWKKRRSRYIYTFDRPSSYKKWLKFNKRFVSIRLTRLYFLTFQDHHLENYFDVQQKWMVFWNKLFTIFRRSCDYYSLSLKYFIWYFLIIKFY
jgi:hypothetical protein